MKITVLGSGTSHGVPVAGCDCEVCRSINPKNKRTRASIFIEQNGKKILVDTATEFRLQAVAAGITGIDAVLYTHGHADHLHGLDDIRIFSKGEVYIPIYGNRETMDEIKNRFDYIFKTTQKGGGKPQIRLNIIEENRWFSCLGIDILPIGVKHGILDILAYRIDNFAYVTDTSTIPEESMKLLTGLDCLILDALREKEHETHFSINQAIEVVERLNPKQAYFTHLCHKVEHDTLFRKLSKIEGQKIKPAFDGLEIVL